MSKFSEQRGSLDERICRKCKMLFVDKYQLDRHMRIGHSPAVEEFYKLSGNTIGKR